MKGEGRVKLCVHRETGGVRVFGVSHHLQKSYEKSKPQSSPEQLSIVRGHHSPFLKILRNLWKGN